MAGNRLTVNVTIGNITLPMSASDTEQEELFRKAANNINQRLITVREKYPTISEKYYDAMVMFNTEVNALSAENKADAGPVFDVLEELEKEIDELIKK